MRLGLFGGTFDPPHVGHLVAASDAFEALALDQVVFIPASQQPLKVHGAMAPAADRLEMVRLLCANDPRFAIDPVEINRGGLSFTVETLREIRARSSATALFLLLGMDAYATLPKWREADAIRTLAEVVVLARGESVSIDGGDMKVVGRRVDISATEVRERIALGLPVTGFVPEQVAAYIAERGLYRA